jgi:nitrogen fixation/metabolism regulation signal transduction histidine kinase
MTLTATQDKTVSTESQLSSRDEMIETLHQKFLRMKRDLKSLQESLSDERRSREEAEREAALEREKRERGERLAREVTD